MAKTKIEWTDESWNPVTGCDAVSPGCDNCYAKAMAKRQKAMGIKKYENEFKVTCHPDELEKPSHWKKPRRIFVNSMSDLFHHEVPDSFIHDVFCVMDENKRHTFQILTKRPKRISKAYEDMWLDSWGQDNIWLGVSVELQKYDWRITDLLQIPAAKRFVSFEPLLGNIKIRPEWVTGWDDCENGIDWVVVGCESGHHRRPCDLDWVYKIVGDCNAFKIPVFVKQLDIDGKVVKDINKFPKDLQIQEFPKGEIE